MTARPAPARRLFAALVVAAAWLAAAGPIAAVDPTPPDGPPANPLDAAILDAALLDGPGGEPRLLTIAEEGGSLVAALLERTDGQWSRITRTRLQSDLWQPGRPWLVGPDAAGRHLLLATDEADGRTEVVALEVRPPGVVDVGRRVLDVPTRDAGLADVDGDGTAELVLRVGGPAGARSPCGTRFVVLDTQELREVRRTELDGLELHGAVLAELDGRAGIDLAAYATRLCGADGVRDPGGRLVGVRLADGTLVGRPVELARGAAVISAGEPDAVDLDADGRPELVIRDGEATIALDPAAGWRRTVVAPAGTVLAGVATGGQGTVVLAAPGSGRRAADPAVVRIGLRRAADGTLVVDAGSGGLTVGEVETGRLGRVLEAVGRARAAGVPSPAWRGDVAGEGCPEIVVPLARISCAGDAGAMLPGPAWIATRPLAAWGDGGSRRALVAATTGWTPGGDGLLPPAPLAATGAGWRHGPSVEFQLAEVSARDLAYFRRYPVPQPSVEGRVAADPVATLGATAGARLVVRIRALADGEGVDGPLPDATALLGAGAAPGEAASLVRIGVPPRTPSGIDNGVARVSLERVVPAGGVARPRWVVTVVGLNDWGELSAPIRQLVASDLLGPALSVEVPLVTAPWPFAAPVRGTTDPGARISLDGGPFEAVSAAGRFEVRRTLAPWPQTVDVRAVDAVGNLTVRRVSLVGGFDYRRLPWQVLVAALVLAGVLASAIRDARRARAVRLLGVAVVPFALAGMGRPGPLRRDLAWGAEDPDVGPLPEIEELPGPT